MVVPLVYLACVLHNTMGCRDAYRLLLLTVLLGGGAGCPVSWAVVGLDLASLGSLHNERKGSMWKPLLFLLRRLKLQGLKRQKVPEIQGLKKNRKNHSLACKKSSRF